MILGQRTIVYGVDDMTKAKQWYNEVLQKTPYFDMPSYVGYDVGGYELGLQPKKKEQKKEKSEGIIAYWGVDSIKEEYSRFLSLGAEVYEEIVDVGENILMASFLDPFQNIFGIIENPHFQIK